MDAFIFFIVFSFIYIDTEAFVDQCPPVKCSSDAPDIQFPFAIQGHNGHNCGQHGFELSCKQNKTIIHFPAYGDLVVKSISYDHKKLNLLDPKNCVHEVFLNLNLSLTPFDYYYVVKDFTYLNCSSRLSTSFDRVPCLSGSNYHVYVVETSVNIPSSCRVTKTIAIPFAYTPYLYDNSFGLGFTWDMACKDCVREGELFGSQNKLGLPRRCFNVGNGKGLSITIFIFMVAMMVSAKTYCYKKMDRHNEKKNQFEAEKLLSDCKTLKPAQDTLVVISKG